MKIILMSMENRVWWSGRLYMLTMSDDYIPLWKKAGIYDLLYEIEGATCEGSLSRLLWALTDMCIHYLEYRAIVKIPPIGDKEGSFMNELLREQVFRQAVAILSMLIQAAELYPRATICRKKEEALLDG